MPIPFSVDPTTDASSRIASQTPPTTAAQPNWLVDTQDYAVDQERYRHQGALDHFGEYAVFVLMWSLVDFAAGLIGRCPTCYLSKGLIADVYGQASDAKCPDCYGTTFEGGYKAIIVRRSIWDSNEEDERTQRRGATITQTASIQASADFRMRTGDFIFREDGSRWQMRTLSSNELRTGFEMPTHESAVVGYNYGTCSREDESSVAYLIPPTNATIALRLGVDHMHYPQGFSDLEDIRGDLGA